MPRNLQNIFFKLSTLAIVIVLSTCIDPYPLETGGGNRILTVDGLLSTGPGPHMVRITYANPYTNRADGNRVLARDAKVYITDDLGNEIELKEEVLLGKWTCYNGGWRYDTSTLGRDFIMPTAKYYTPEGFCANVGRTYTLHITTPDGQQYVSRPEKVMPVAELEQVDILNTRSASFNPLIDNKGLELIAHFTDSEELGNYYYWKISNSFMQLVTEPHLARGNSSSCCNLCYIPDMHIDGTFSTMSDEAFNGLKTRQQVIRIADDGIRFKSRYRVQLNQYSVSQEAYEFLKLVRQQLDIQGSVFDPPPANIRGNITNVENPNQQVLGYFIAADVSSQMMYVNRADIPREYLAIPRIVPRDCRDYCGFLHEPPKLYPPEDWVYF